MSIECYRTNRAHTFLFFEIKVMVENSGIILVG
jgi:hypothetical protein